MKILSLGLAFLCATSLNALFLIDSEDELDSNPCINSRPDPHDEKEPDDLKNQTKPEDGYQRLWWCLEYFRSFLNNYSWSFFASNTKNYDEAQKLVLNQKQQIDLVLALLLIHKYGVSFSIKASLSYLVKELKISRVITVDDGIRQFLTKKERDTNFTSIYDKLKILNQKEISMIAKSLLEAGQAEIASLGNYRKDVENYVIESLKNIANYNQE
jgi:hypothetical protein